MLFLDLLDILDILDFLDILDILDLLDLLDLLDFEIGMAYLFKNPVIEADVAVRFVDYDVKVVNT